MKGIKTEQYEHITNLRRILHEMISGQSNTLCQFPVDFVTLNDEIPNAKLHRL